MSNSHHSLHPGGNENIEKKDVHFPRIILVLAVVAVFVTISAITCVLVFKGLEVWFNYQDKPAPKMMRDNILPPEPRLQELPLQDIKAYWKEQKAIIEGYAVLDPEAQIARIPVAHAMRMLAEKPDIFRESKPVELVKSAPTELAAESQKESQQV